MNQPLQKPIIYLITGGDADSDNINIKKKEVLERVRMATAAGVSLIQIREKNLTARSLLELTEAAVKITRGTTTKLLVNGRTDIALAAGADGVHLPTDGIPARIVRRSVPSEFLIGVSTHSAQAALAAREEGADFVTFGPVFESPGKREPQGVEALGHVCKLLGTFPVIALGGIDESNCRQVLEIGASGFAAIRFLNKTDNFPGLLANL